MRPISPSMLDVAVAHLLDPAYLRSRAAMIDRSQAQVFGAGAPTEGGTVCLAAGDAEGMMVSYIQSNYSGFGSGVVVPGTGISLQNRGLASVSSRAIPIASGLASDRFTRSSPASSCGRRAAHGVRADGRTHPGAGPFANDAAHPTLGSGSANRSGRAAMAIFRGLRVAVESHCAEDALQGLSQSSATNSCASRRTPPLDLAARNSSDERRTVLSADPTPARTATRRVFEGCGRDLDVEPIEAIPSLVGEQRAPRTPSPLVGEGWGGG